MKTSLGIWAFGNMATRFNPGGYKPELAGQTTTDRVRTAVAGLGDLIDDYEFHYPQELSPENLDEVREALDGHGIYCVASGLHLDPRFAKGALCSPDDATREEALRLTREAIDLAGETGAQMIIWPGIEGYNYPFQTPYKESWARFVDGVGQAAQHAKEQGVAVFLEHKNSEPAMKILMRNIGMTLHVIHTLRRQGIDNVTVNMDWQHLIMNGESLAEYAALLASEGLLGHLHANDGWGTFDDDNMVGTIRFMETIELAVELRRAGYGDNGERLGFDLYPYTEDAVALGQAERAAVAVHRRHRVPDRRRGAACGTAREGRGAGLRARLRRDGSVRCHEAATRLSRDRDGWGRRRPGVLRGTPRPGGEAGAAEARSQRARLVPRRRRSGASPDADGRRPTAERALLSRCRLRPRRPASPDRSRPGSRRARRRRSSAGRASCAATRSGTSSS